MPKKKTQNIPEMQRTTNGKARDNRVNENERKMALAQLQEMFTNQLEPGIVSLILSECEFNVDEALEKLFTISSAESESENAVKCTSDEAVTPNHGYITGLDDFHDDEKHSMKGTTCSSDSETKQCVDVKSSQGLSSVLASQSNMSGLPDFPEIFTTGSLGNYNVYTGLSASGHSTDGELFVEADVSDHSCHVKQFEDEKWFTHGFEKTKDSDYRHEGLSETVEVDKKTRGKHVASKLDYINEFGCGVNDEALPDGASILSQDSLRTQKIEDQGHNLLDHDSTKRCKGSLIHSKAIDDRAMSGNVHDVCTVKNDTEGTEKLHSMSKQRREERKQNDADIQGFNRFVKQISSEGPKSSDWKMHIKRDSSKEGKNFRSTFSTNGHSGLQSHASFPSGPPGLLTHDFRTRMNPYGDYRKMTPHMLNENKNGSIHEPGKVHSPDGFVTSAGHQVSPIRTAAPYFQQRPYHVEQIPPAGPNHSANVGFPRMATAQGPTGIEGPDYRAQGPDWRTQGLEWGTQGPRWRTQGPEWRTQSPEWRTQTYQRNSNKKFQQQGPSQFFQPNFVPQNQGSAVHANQSDGTVSSGHDKRLFIMRGLPGSGKSFLARKLRGFHGVILSTDDFFVQNGRYIFDVSLIGEAHEWNQSRAKRAMEGAMNPLIIDNTNTQAWEMRPYVALGLKFGYWVEFKEPGTPWKWNIKELLRRNQHDVSEAAISRMLDRYEHNMNVAKVMNSRRSEFVTPQRVPQGDQSKKNFSDNSKTNGLERNVSETTVEEEPKAQRVRQPRTRRKHQEGAVLSSDQSSDIATEKDTTHSLKDNAMDDTALVSESGPVLGSSPLAEKCNEPNHSVLALADEDAENSDTEMLVCTGHKSVSESEDKATDTSVTENECTADLETSGSLRPQRSNAASRRRKQRERRRGHGFVGEQDTMGPEVNHENTCHSNIKKFSENGSVMGTRSASLLCKRYTEIEFDLSDASAESLEDDQQRSRSANIISLKDSAKVADVNDCPSQVSFVLDAHSTGKGHPEGVVSMDEVTGDAETKNVGLSSLKSNIDKKCAGGKSERQHATLKPVACSFDALGRDTSSQEFAFVATTESCAIPNNYSQERSNLSEAKPEAKMESFLSGDHIQAQSPVPLSQLLASATKSKRPFLKARRTSPKTPENVPPSTLETQDSISEVRQKSPECPESTNLDSLTSQFCTEESSVGDSVDTTGSICHDKDTDVISSSNYINMQTKDQDGNKVYEFLKTCFPHVDRDVIVDLLARYGNGEEAVPQVIDKLLSVPVSGLNPDTLTNEEATEEFPTETSQQPDHVNTQLFLDVDQSEDSNLRYSTADAVFPNNSSMRQATNAGSISFSLPQAPFSSNSGVPSFPDTSFLSSKLANPTIFSNPSQTLSVGASSNTQFPGIMSTREFSSSSKVKCAASNETSDVKSSSGYESRSTAPDIFSENSTTLLPGFHIGPSAGGKTSTLQEESGNVQGMQKNTLHSFPNVPFCSNTTSAEPRRAKHTAAEDNRPVFTTSDSTARRQGAVHSLDHLQLTLEPALAMQLVEMFGGIRGLKCEGEIAETNLVVKLDGKLAKILYEKWKATIQEKTIGRQSDSLQQVMEEEMAQELNRKQKGKTTSKQSDSLQQIMEEEMAQELNRKLKAESDSPVTTSTLATDLRRQKLYTMFPGVDKVALDELLQANRYELTPTVEMVKLSCGLQEKPRNVIASGPTQPLPPAQNVTANGQTEEDWSWIYQRVSEAAENQVDSNTTRQDSYQALDEPGYADYRAEAAMHARQRDDCFKKAALAFSKKQGALAELYAQQGHQHTQKLKEANWRAARKILQNKNWDRDENTIDLHGLHVQEALCALEELLLVRATGTTVMVVTGRGSHSKGGRAKIKPAVTDYLARNNYRFEEVNQGLVKVFL